MRFISQILIYLTPDMVAPLQESTIKYATG
jgi:hypothetical protein